MKIFESPYLIQFIKYICRLKNMLISESHALVTSVYLICLNYNVLIILFYFRNLLHII